jgi:NADH:ubiquinone reductase (non-electrogenic)
MSRLGTFLRKSPKYIFGAATISGGAYLYQWKSFEFFFDEPHPEDKPRLVVLGTGWAAMSLLSEIDCEKYNVSIVSPRNYFVFTPFLPCTTVGTIEWNHCIESVRRVLFRFRKRAKYYEAAASDIDFENNKVTCSDVLKKDDDPTKSFELPYEQLVIALGADNNTFNTKGVYEHATFLKSLEDAKAIRKRILNNFEQAALPSTTEEERRRLLHFVIVGGGPTGVEFAAELHDYVHDDLSKYFAKECKKYLKITIVEGMDRVLNAFDKEIAKYTQEKFKRNGVEVITKTFVTGVGGETIDFMDARTKERTTHPHGLVVWATGITTKPVVKGFMSKLGTHQKNARALTVDGRLTVKGCTNVYGIGDCSTIQCEKLETLLDSLWNQQEYVKDGGLTFETFQKFVADHRKQHVQLDFLGDRLEQLFEKHDTEKNALLSKSEFKKLIQEADSKITALPPTAQVAAQQGSYIAQRLNHLGDTRHSVMPFAYNHRGSFAYVGSDEAVYDSDMIKLKGGAAFWGRNTAYLSKLFSWESKRNIMWDLFWSKWFGRDIATY